MRIEHREQEIIFLESLDNLPCIALLDLVDADSEMAQRVRPVIPTAYESDRIEVVFC